MPVLTIVTLFSIIWTFADFQLVYVLTRGGPTNSTHLLATLAYQIGMTVSSASARRSSLWMFPFMAALVVAVLWYRAGAGTASANAVVAQSHGVGLDRASQSADLRLLGAAACVHHHHLVPPTGCSWHPEAKQGAVQPARSRSSGSSTRPWTITCMFANTLYATWLMNTLIVSIASTAISLVFGSWLVRCWRGSSFWGPRLLGVAIFVSYLVPDAALHSDV